MSLYPVVFNNTLIVFISPLSMLFSLFSFVFCLVFSTFFFLLFLVIFLSSKIDFFRCLNISPELLFLIQLDVVTVIKIIIIPVKNVIINFFIFISALPYKFVLYNMASLIFLYQKNRTSLNKLILSLYPKMPAPVF